MKQFGKKNAENTSRFWEEKNGKTESQKKNHICFENTQRRSPTIHGVKYIIIPKKKKKNLKGVILL